MCKVISICNQKGGVGKTSTSVNLGIGLANEGKKVLFIDADPQGSLTISLGNQTPDSLENTLTNVMLKIVNEENVEPGFGIIHYNENVDLMPANIELATLEITLTGVMCREQKLGLYVNQMKEYYDYIIIDCMPSLGIMTINALACSDSVIIPVVPANLPVKGLQQLIKTIFTIKRGLNTKLEIEGILFTLVDNRTNDAKNYMTAVNNAYGQSIPIFPVEIPLTVKVPESSTAGLSIYKYDPKGKGATAYKRLTMEVLNRG